MKPFKLTEADKAYLFKHGELAEDFEQIEQGINVGEFRYKNRKISYKKAIELLGRETFLNGASRAAFHWSSGRETLEGGEENVIFDFSALFLPTEEDLQRQREDFKKQKQEEKEQYETELKQIREICKKCSCRLYQIGHTKTFSLYCVVNEPKDKELYFITIENFTADKFTKVIMDFYNRKDLHGTLLERHAKNSTDDITTIFCDVKFAIDNLKSLKNELRAS